MKTRKSNRLLALLLCMCMALGILPLSGVAFAAGQGCNHVHDSAVCGYVEAVEGKSCKHVHNKSCGGLNSLGQSGPLALPQGRATIPEMNPKAVGFAGAEWWVIGKDGAGVNSVNGTMTLLSKGNLFSTTFHDSSSEYGGSTLHEKMKGYYNGLSADEKALILPRTLDGVRVGGDSNAILPGDHYVWPLSQTEAESLPQDTIRANGSAWWLRSAGSDITSGAVNDDGTFATYHVLSGRWERPALTLNLDSVLFTSAAAGGKPAAGSGLQAYSAPTGTAKLTVKDDVNLALNVTTTGPIKAEVGGTASFAYTGAKTGTGRSVSVLIQNKTTGAILYYGRPVDCATANASGTASFQLPDGLAAGEYTLLAFNEQVNGGNVTDFASTPKELTLKVEPKSTPDVPGVANGDTVYFAGNEWFVIGLNGAGVNSQNGTMTLLSKESLFTTKFHDGGSSAYGGSTLHEKMKEYYNGLSDDEKALILPRTLDGVRVGDDYNATLTGNHYVWPLSQTEAESLDKDTIRANGSLWWLRSAYSDDNFGAGAVDYVGDMRPNFVGDDWGGRPALTINLDDAIFATASAGEGGSISPSGKVVVPKDGSQTFTIKADEGYQVNQVLVDGQPVSLTGDSYTLTVAAENRTIKASFVEAPPIDVPGVANGSTVYFAGNEWFVIGLNGAGVNSQNGTMTLLSKENLFTTKFHDSSNEYGGSTLHEKMKEYYNGLSADEKALILPRTLDGVRVGRDSNAILPGDHYVWPLSQTEAESLDKDTIRANGFDWWLRSASLSGSGNGVDTVDFNGNVSADFVICDWGGRPALTINLNDAIFATASAGEHGSISPSGKVVVPKGGSQTFAIKADEGYQVNQVLVDGQPVSLTGDSYTLTNAAANCTIEASFAKTYQLTVQAGTGGRITQGASGGYTQGARIALKAEVDTGYTFTGWTASNGGTFDNANSASTTFNMPANATTVTANFAKDEVPPDHQPIDPPDPDVPLDTAKDAVWRFQGEYANLLAISLNGHALTLTPTGAASADLSGYPGYSGVLGKAESGSVVVTLYKEFLQHLPGGKYTLTASFNDGGAPGELPFTVPQKTDPGPTTYPLTFQTGTGGKIIRGVSGSYAAGTNISLQAEANADYAFDGWISSNGGTFSNAASATTTFTMPASATIVTASFRYIGGPDPDPGPSYSWRTLTDPSGVRVNGLFTDDAALKIKERQLHPQGDCPVCDDIRARQDKGELLVLFDISLKSGKYKGDLTVEIPVDEKYNGQTVIFLHCKDKVLESRTITASGGYAKGTFSSLSPFAVAKQQPGKTAITGLPESYTLLVGQSVSWTPKPAGGTWSYDKDLLSMTQDGDTYIFTARKTGKAMATYTADGMPHTITITVNSATIPQTGDVDSPWVWALLMLAALIGCRICFGCKAGEYGMAIRHF